MGVPPSGWLLAILLRLTSCLQMAFNRSLLILCMLFPHPVLALDVGAPVLETRHHLGGPAHGPCAGGWPSANGRYLAFTCRSGDIVVGDTNGTNDTFLLDRETGLVERVSVDSAGNQALIYSSGGGIPSDDGRFVAFTSTARLDPILDFPYFDFGWTNAFIRDRVAGTTTLAGKNAHGGYAVSGETQLSSAAMSKRLVVFAATADMVGNTVGPVANQIYVRNWQTGQVELVTATPVGALSAFGGTGAAAISGNGRFVTFMSGASDLGPSNPTNATQLMFRDLQTGITRRLSFPAGGGEFSPGGYQQSREGHLTDDGRYIAVRINSDEIVPAGAPGRPDVYVVDTVTAVYELVSRGHDGQPPDDASLEIAISGDGRYVAFFSRASNLLPMPQPHAIYVKDRFTGELVNVTASLGPAPLFIPNLRFSADGATLAFDWLHGPGDPLLAGRTLIYTVAIRGTPIAKARPVPAVSRGMLVALSVGLGLFGLWFCAFRNLPAARGSGSLSGDVSTRK